MIYLNKKNTPIYQSTNFREYFSINSLHPTTQQMEKFVHQNYGWKLQEISHLAVNINKFSLLKGSFYFELPYSIEMKNACVNVDNDNIF